MIKSKIGIMHPTLRIICRSLLFSFLTIGYAFMTGELRGAEKGYQAVEFDTTDSGNIHGSLFLGKKQRAVVLAHGAIFNKESWYPLARRLQQVGLTCLSIDFRGYGKSTAKRAADKHFDVLGAVAFLKNKGFASIALVGGSMGAMAVLEALDHSTNKAIDKAIILAAPSGRPIMSKDIDTLFIVSENDPVAPRLKTIYEKSTQPKQIKILPGRAHAQHIFKTEQAANMTKLISEFLR